MDSSEENHSVKKPKIRCSNVYVPPPARKLSNQQNNPSERISSSRPTTFDETKACNDSSLLFLNDGGHTYSELRSNRFKRTKQCKKHRTGKDPASNSDITNSQKNETKSENASLCVNATTNIVTSQEDVTNVSVGEDINLSSNNNNLFNQINIQCRGNLEKLCISAESISQEAKHIFSKKLDDDDDDEIREDLLVQAKSKKNVTLASNSDIEKGIMTDRKTSDLAEVTQNSNKNTEPIESQDKNTPSNRLHSSESCESSLKTANDKSLVIEENDWESLYNDSGECVAEDKILTSSECREVNKNQFEKEYDRELVENKESILEIYGFSPEINSNDLMTVLSAYTTRGLKLVWVDDTHALAIFPSTSLADEVLVCDLPLVRTRPLSQATPASQEKARHLVLPSTLRPKTCPAMARRLVSGALGLSLRITPEARAAERELLRKAREEKRLAARQRDAAWEGVFEKKEF